MSTPLKKSRHTYQQLICSEIPHSALVEYINSRFKSKLSKIPGYTLQDSSLDKNGKESSERAILLLKATLVSKDIQFSTWHLGPIRRVDFGVPMEEISAQRIPND